MVNSPYQSLFRQEVPIGKLALLAQLRGQVGVGHGFLSAKQKREMPTPEHCNQCLERVVAGCVKFGLNLEVGFSVGHHLLRRLICTFDGKARAGMRQGVNPAARPNAFVASSPLKKGDRMIARFKLALARIEDHWLADLIGAVSLFGLLWAGLFLGYAWGL